MKGKIKFFNSGRGFGKIDGDDGKLIFVHATAIEGAIKGVPENLNEGDYLEYEVEETPKGLSAINARRVTQEPSIGEETGG